MGTKLRPMLRGCCEQFLRQAAIHHASGDYYPDPSVISGEIGFCPHLAERVVGSLWAEHLIARSPYATERIRITPYGWEHIMQCATRAAA